MSQNGERERPSVAGVLRDHRRTLATAGLVVVALQGLRSSREAIIPLWGPHRGDVGQISLIFAAAAAVEILMVYPAGRVMDARGRK